MPRLTDQNILHPEPLKNRKSETTSKPETRNRAVSVSFFDEDSGTYKLKSYTIEVEAKEVVDHYDDRIVDQQVRLPLISGN
jgi:predicted ATPase